MALPPGNSQRSQSHRVKSLPEDYVERVYAGVLGKMIGVYLGRPFEGWSHARIQQELGEIRYYVHDRLDKPLIVTDDDLSGTFTFLRALPDHGTRPDLSAAQIGETWLNYLIENRTTLWWGGLGNSTEHTAYLRLKAGLPAPLSGAASTNSRTVAEQIGAQIFIDGWGMVAPGDPELAASLAQRAASVSHDGEAVYAAQVIAAMEAQAFIESDLNRLLNTGVGMIPRDSTIYRLIADLREWFVQVDDWRAARRRLEQRYGYDLYPGNCHVVPNHGLVILSLLYGRDDFQESLAIVNTSGWDTDCNSGNVGCLLGIKNGLAEIDSGPDWRSPIADRLYLVSAEGGEAVSDAVRVAYFVANLGRALAGEPALQPKGGRRFHFEAPGALQGFAAQSGPGGSALRLENVARRSLSGERCLALHYDLAAPDSPARAATPTFIPPEEREMPGYGLQAAPTLYAGQQIQASLRAGESNTSPVDCRILVGYYGERDEASTTLGPPVRLAPNEAVTVSWRLALPAGATAYQTGVELSSTAPARGTLFLDSLGWSGTPEVTFAPPPGGGEMWRRAWVNGVDGHLDWPGQAFYLVQNQGRGLVMTGTREWVDFAVRASLTPRLAKAAGIAVRVQGMRRYYALLLCAGGILRLVRVCGEEQVLAEAPLPWELWQAYMLRLQVAGQRLQAWVGERLCFDVVDEDDRLPVGGAGLVIEEGCLASDGVTVGAAA